MSSSQALVVTWIEWAAAGAVLQLAARVALGWVRQPADRIALILMTFGATAAIPVLMVLAPVAPWRLGLVGDLSKPLLTAPTATVEPSPAVAVPRWEAEPGPRLLSPSPHIVVDATERIAPPTPLAPTPASPITAPSSGPNPWLLAAVVLVVLQAVACLYFAMQWLLGTARLRRFVARSRQAAPAVASIWGDVAGNRGHGVRIGVSDEIDTPITFGLVMPTVILPGPVADGDRATLRFCLAHEWSHLDRRDLLAWSFAGLCEFGLWFQPLYWVLRRELRVCQDIIADDRAAAAGGDSIEYSELLVRFAQNRVPRSASGAMAFLDRPSQLARRIQTLLRPAGVLRPRSGRVFCASAGVLLFLGAVLLSAVRMTPALAADMPIVEKRAAKDQFHEKPGASRADAMDDLRYSLVIVDRQTGNGIPEVTVRVQQHAKDGDSILKHTEFQTNREGELEFVVPPDQFNLTSIDIRHAEYTVPSGTDLFDSFPRKLRKSALVETNSFQERIELEKLDPVTGTVVDPQGSPLKGILVEGYVSDPLTGGGHFTSAFTDEKGRFQLDLKKGDLRTIEVLPEEYASTFRLLQGTRGDLGTITLEQGMRISGKVIRASGEPVVGIPVASEYAGDGGDVGDHVLTPIKRRAVTDKEGHFVLAPLPSGLHRLFVDEFRREPIAGETTKHIIPSAFLSSLVKIEKGLSATPIEFREAPYAVFRAQFADDRGRKATDGIRFTMKGRLGAQTWSAYAVPDEGGVIEARIPKGLRNTTMSPEWDPKFAFRYRRGAGQVLENLDGPIDLGTAENDLRDFEVVRFRAPTVTVKVVDETDAPISGFQIRTAWGQNPAVGETPEKQEDGGHRISLRVFDQPVTFTVFASGYESNDEVVQLPEGGSRDLTIRLKAIRGARKPPAGKLAAPLADAEEESRALRYGGTVVDKETGHGIPEATVIVRCSTFAGEEERGLDESRHTTDAAGRFEFAIPPEQAAKPELHVAVDVKHPGYAAPEGLSGGLGAIRRNETLGDRPFFETIELVPSDPVTGVVVDPNGQPLPGVRIEGYSQASAGLHGHGSFTEAVTDDAGRFRLSFVKAGIGVLWILPKDLALVAQVIRKQRDLGTVTLRPGVRVSGRVLGVEGKPVVGLPVHIADWGEPDDMSLPISPSRERNAVTDQEGRFSFAPLPRGSYRVVPDEHHRISRQGDRKDGAVSGVFLPTTVELREGTTAVPVEIQALPHVMVRAQIYDSRGQKTQGSPMHLQGYLDGELWSDDGLPDSNGAITMAVPHALKDVEVRLQVDGAAVRFRKRSGRVLENQLGHSIELGTLLDDIAGLEIVRYESPVVVVKTIDEQGLIVPGTRVAATYPWGTQPYLLEGGLRSDFPLKRQSDGRYRTSEMLPGEDVTFTITASGHQTATEMAQLSEGETKELLVTLKKGPKKGMQPTDGKPNGEDATEPTLK